MVGLFVLMDRWSHRLRCPLVFIGSFGQLLCFQFGLSWLDHFNIKVITLCFLVVFYLNLRIQTIHTKYYLSSLYIYSFVHKWVVELAMFRWYFLSVCWFSHWVLLLILQILFYNFSLLVLLNCNWWSVCMFVLILKVCPISIEMSTNNRVSF